MRIAKINIKVVNGGFMKKNKENCTSIRCPYCGVENEENKRVCKSCGRLINECGSVPKDFRPIGALLVILVIFAIVVGGTYFIWKNKEKIISGIQSFNQSDNRNDYSAQSNNLTNDYESEDDFIEIYDNKTEENIGEPQYWGIITSTYSKGIAIHPIAQKDSEVLSRIPYQEVFPIYYIEPNTTYGYTTYNGVSGYINLDYADIYDNNYEADSYSEDLTDYGLYKDGHGINVYDYVIADSDSRYLTQDDIDKLTLRGINYAKNEIYARHGRDFKSSELQRFFNSRYWYHVQYTLTDENDAIITNSFNQYEKENNKFLNEAETRLGIYDLDK